MKSSSRDLKKRIASLRNEVFFYIRGRKMVRNDPIKSMSRTDFLYFIFYLKTQGDCDYEILDEHNNICAIFFEGEEIGRAYYRIKMFHVYEDVFNAHEKQFRNWQFEGGKRPRHI